MKKRKILLVTSFGLSRGGVETFLMNWIHQADNMHYEFSWFFPYNNVDKTLKKDFEKMGVHFFAGGLHSGKNRMDKCANLIRIRWALKRVLNNNHFDAIHINTGSLIVNNIALRLAKKKKIEIRISHSHSADAMIVSAFKQRLFNIFRHKINRNVTKRIACSEIAAEALFGKDFVKDTIIVNNGIDTHRFSFSDEARKRCREDNNLKNCFVIGEIGEISYFKNQMFLIDVFERIYQIDSTSRLVLVGSGPDEEKIKLHTKELGLEKVVILTGKTDMPEDYYCAMDVFVLPSLMEGLSFAWIEAQASGLPCIMSTGNSREGNLTGHCKFLSLNDTLEIWASEILSYKSFDIQFRYGAAKVIEEKNYGLTHFKSLIKKIYEE